MGVSEQVKSMRRQAWNEKVAAMRSGVRLRPVTFKSGREYRRKEKHPGRGGE